MLFPAKEEEEEEEREEKWEEEIDSKHSLRMLTDDQSLFWLKLRFVEHYLIFFLEKKKQVQRRPTRNPPIFNEG